MQRCSLVSAMFKACAVAALLNCNFGCSCSTPCLCRKCESMVDKAAYCQIGRGSDWRRILDAPRRMSLENNRDHRSLFPLAITALSCKTGHTHLFKRQPCFIESGPSCRGLLVGRKSGIMGGLCVTFQLPCAGA